ncbi:hypothetical protein [Chryseobacterium sp. Hurlbut01]|uniref:hypothetical protein n=1 Tax=Chryseobacterium sp. Hurlbut01 TaxID=1681828 RepID=UPI00067C7EF4|nr:hypothetical protein [Chryseobacterium sp. Hurlbut01]
MSKFNTTINEIFPHGIPLKSEWLDHQEIINVLNKVGGLQSSNHLFYPNGGGLDLQSATTSHEDDCIEIYTSRSEVISPLKLTFHSFKGDNENEWSYFRIETKPLKQTDVYDTSIEFMEPLTELFPLDYVDRRHWDDGEYNGKSLPNTARILLRWLKGSMVIFGKSSHYNHHNRTYDGRHNRYDDDQFRNYIENVRSNGWPD